MDIGGGEGDRIHKNEWRVGEMQASSYGVNKHGSRVYTMRNIVSDTVTALYGDKW